MSEILQAAGFPADFTFPRRSRRAAGTDGGWSTKCPLLRREEFRPALDAKRGLPQTGLRGVTACFRPRSALCALGFGLAARAGSDWYSLEPGTSCPTPKVANGARGHGAQGNALGQKCETQWAGQRWLCLRVPPPRYPVGCHLPSAVFSVSLGCPNGVAAPSASPARRALPVSYRLPHFLRWMRGSASFPFLFPDCGTSRSVAEFPLPVVVRIFSWVGRREDLEKLLPPYPGGPVVFPRVTAGAELWLGNSRVVLLRRTEDELCDLTRRSHPGRFVCQTLPQPRSIGFLPYDGVAPAVVLQSIVFLSSARECWGASRSLKTLTEGPCSGFSWTHRAPSNTQIF